MVVEMLCREVMLKSNQSFSIRKSDGEEKNVVFKGVGIHIFDRSQGCFKPVTIVTPSVQLVEPVLIFSRAAVDQSWVMIALFDDNFAEGFSLHKVSFYSSSSSSPANPEVTITLVSLMFPSKASLQNPQFPIDCCPKCGCVTIADWQRNTFTIVDSNHITQRKHYVTASYRPSTATSSSLTKAPALLVGATPSLWPAVWNGDSHSTQTSRHHCQHFWPYLKDSCSLILSSVMITDWLPAQVRMELSTSCGTSPRRFSW